MKCDQCGRRLQIGDWPHCPHESTRPELAQRFKPIVVFKSTDGRYSFPMHADQAVPAGYQRVEISTRRQAERLEREVNRSLREEKLRSSGPPIAAQDHAALRRLARGERVTIPAHDEHGNVYMKVLDGSQMRGAFRQYAEQIAELESGRNTNFDPGFHIDIMHNNASNRAAYEDSSTGWRPRKD